MTPAVKTALVCLREKERDRASSDWDDWEVPDRSEDYQSAWIEGALTGMRTSNAKDNPFPFGSMLREAWRDGFHAAQHRRRGYPRQKKQSKKRGERSEYLA